MCADEEPNYDVGHDFAPMNGPAATEPPNGGAAGGTETGTETQACHTVVHGHAVDGMCRTHAILFIHLLGLGLQSCSQASFCSEYVCSDLELSGGRHRASRH